MLQLVRISFLVITYVIIVVLQLTTKEWHPPCQIQVQCCLLVLVPSFYYPPPTFYPPTPLLNLPVHSLPLPPLSLSYFCRIILPPPNLSVPQCFNAPCVPSPITFKFTKVFFTGPYLSQVFFYFTEIILIKMYFWAKLK